METTKTKLFVPMVIHPHNFGEENGDFLLGGFLTLERLRKYYPEPIQYFEIN